MSTAIYVEVTIDTRTCPVCGVHYGIDQALLERRQRDGGNWFCTNGHSLHCIEPEVERLRKQLDEQKARATRMSAEVDQAYALAATRAKEIRTLKRRVTNGICPCCKRTFANVSRHMQTKHPEQVVHA